MDYDFEKLAVNFSRRFLKAGDVLFREGILMGMVILLKQANWN